MHAKTFIQLVIEVFCFEINLNKKWVKGRVIMCGNSGNNCAFILVLFILLVVIACCCGGRGLGAW